MNVTATFLPTLRVTPVLGRNFTAEEDRPGGNTRVVVMSDGLWKRAFGADPSVIGRIDHLELATLHGDWCPAAHLSMGHEYRSARHRWLQIRRGIEAIIASR